MVNKEDFMHRLMEGQRGWFDLPGFMKTIKGARQDAGLTQKELAKVLDTSPAMYSRYERGLSSPGHWQVQLLSWLFDVPFGYFHYITNSEQAMHDMIVSDMQKRMDKMRGAK